MTITREENIHQGPFPSPLGKMNLRENINTGIAVLGFDNMSEPFTPRCLSFMMILGLNFKLQAF